MLGKIIPIDSYFSEGWLNHQSDIVIFHSYEAKLPEGTSAMDGPPLASANISQRFRGESMRPMGISVTDTT